MMKRRLAVLGLGVLMSASMLTPVSANELPESKEGKRERPRMARNINTEDKQEWVNRAIEKLEQALADGKITEEDYNMKKERLTMIQEAIQNGEMPEGLAKRGKKDNKEDRKGRFNEEAFSALSQEEQIAKVDEMIAGLQAKLQDGKIDQERYDEILAKMEDMKTKIENGEEISFVRGKTGFKKFKGFAELSKEEKLAKVDEMLAKLQEKYEAGNVEEERYNNAKAKLEEMRTKVENDEPIFKHKGKGIFDNMREFANLSQEEQLAKLDEKLASVTEKFENGELESERYEKAKAHIEALRTKIENGEKITNSFGNKLRKAVRDKGVFKDLTPEELEAKVAEKIAVLDEKLANGEIEQERYDNMTERINKALEKILEQQQ